MFLLPREGRYWLLAVLVLFVAGWIKGINLILLLAYLMMSLLVLNWLLAFRQLRKISARRQAPALLFAGEETPWQVQVANQRSTNPSGITIVDTGADHRQQWFLSRMEPDTTAHLIGRATFPKRGRYPLNPLRAECLHPFGLTGRSQVIGPADEWIVLPRLGRLNGARFRRWLSTAARGDGRVHRLARPSMVRQDDLHGLRPFRPGDSPRWIHWRTSARRNQKMVREFEEAAGQNLVVVFDTWSATPGNIGTDPDFEAAISLAASVCNEWCSQRQDQIVLVIAGQSVQVTSGYTCRATLVQLLRSLALVEGQSTVAAHPVIQALATRSILDAAVLIVGSRKSSPLATALASSWHRLVVSLSPASARDFYDPPGTRVNPEKARPMLQPVRG